MLWRKGALAILTDSLYVGCGQTIRKAGDVVKIACDKEVKGPMSRIQVYISKGDEEKDMTHTAFADDLINTTPKDIGKWT